MGDARAESGRQREDEEGLEGVDERVIFFIDGEVDLERIQTATNYALLIPSYSTYFSLFITGLQMLLGVFALAIERRPAMTESGRPNVAAGGAKTMKAHQLCRKI